MTINKETKETLKYSAIFILMAFIFILLHKICGGYKVERKPVPDPVVLCKVINKKEIVGYVVVTAWGPEEEAEELKK